MKLIRCFLFFITLGISLSVNAQCNQITFVGFSINSNVCNGDGTSTVSVNVEFTVGGGNNSVTLGYNLGSLEVAVITWNNTGGDVNGTFEITVPSCNPYTVSLIAWSNPDGGGNPCSDPAPIVINTTPLPVTFENVDVTLNNSDLIVHWATLSEVNNEKFIIERSSGENPFDDIGTVRGAGNSNDRIEYVFRDIAPYKNMNFYRIKQVDYDGRFSYSKIVSHFYRPESKILIYPNPSYDLIHISASKTSNYYLMHSSGKIEREITALSNDHLIDITSLSQGIYYLLDSNYKIVQRIVKL